MHKPLHKHQAIEHFNLLYSIITWKLFCDENLDVQHLRLALRRRKGLARRRHSSRDPLGRCPSELDLSRMRRPQRGFWYDWNLGCNLSWSITYCTSTPRQAINGAASKSLHKKALRLNLQITAHHAHMGLFAQFGGKRAQVMPPLRTNSVSHLHHVFFPNRLHHQQWTWRHNTRQHPRKGP